MVLQAILASPWTAPQSRPIMRAVRTLRVPVIVIGLAASAACASAPRHAPRPFPTAPSPAEVTGITPETPAVPAGGAAAPEPAAAPAAPPPPALPGAIAPAPDSRAAMAADVLATALDLRGAPYRLGGTDPSGFDCSGFVQYVLARHAIAMPRTVIQQFVVGSRTRDVEAGDLVFFRTAGRRASHVGIALDGESFVHAPSSRDVSGVKSRCERSCSV